MTGYEQLLDLAHRELDLVEAGRFEEVVTLAAERRALVASLPAEAPPEARELLARAEEVVRRTISTTESELAGVRAQLAGLRRMRPALASYARGRDGRSTVELTG